MRSSKAKQKIFYFNSITSTQDIAKELAEKNYPSGTVVTARMQTAGRGRLNRKWYSPRGGIYFSVILRPEMPPADINKINVIASVAVCDVLNQLYKLPAKCKWPNDVIINGKKLCGILVEMNSEVNKIHWVVLGIGINANISKNYINSKTKFMQPVTSIEIELNKKIALKKLFNALIEKLQKYYRDLYSSRFQKILNHWKELSETIGKKVKIVLQDETLKGTAIDLTENGALILNTESSARKEIFSGDCIHIESPHFTKGRS